MADLSLSKLPWKAQLGLCALLSLAAAGAFYYFYEVPAAERAAARQQELDTVNARIAKGQDTARKLDEFRQEVGTTQARLESQKQKLPDEKDAADLLRRVNTLAADSRLIIRSFRPQAITTKQIHAEWPIALELEGTYHNLGLFLDRVSKLPRIINVGTLDIRGKDEATAGGSIVVTCTATTFVLLDQDATSEAATPGKKAAAAGKKSE